MPHAVKLLGRYDVWDKKCEETPWRHILAFQYGMRLDEWPPDAPEWELLMGALGVEAEVDFVKKTVSAGHGILKYEAKQNGVAMSALAFETEFEGLRALAANRGPGNSHLFDSHWDPDCHDVMISFYWSQRGQWKVGLYTTHPTIDCGALCKKHGGGGHPGAAEFQCDELPFALKGR